MPRDDPPWALFLTCSLSHITLLAPLLQLFHRRWWLEFYISLFGLTSSFMYHTCESFQTRIVLSELQWHRLDNIGVLSSFAIFWIYMACIPSPAVEAAVKFVCFFVIVVVQERDPWNEVLTFVPILAFSMIPVVTHLLLGGWLRSHSTVGGGGGAGSVAAVSRLWGCRKPNYERKNVVLGFGLLAVALPFFVAGLDDENDPYRVFHGMWHLLVGVSSLFLWRIVRLKHQHHHYHHHHTNNTQQLGLAGGTSSVVGVSIKELTK